LGSRWSANELFSIAITGDGQSHGDWFQPRGSVAARLQVLGRVPCSTAHRDSGAAAT
jgi:hypothetical protein